MSNADEFTGLCFINDDDVVRNVQLLWPAWHWCLRKQKHPEQTALKDMEFFLSRGTQLNILVSGAQEQLDG